MIAGASPALCQNEGEGFLFGSPNLSKDQLQWLVGRMIQRQEVQKLGGLGAGQSGLQNDIAANVQKMGADAVAGLKAAATLGRSALPGTGPAPTGGGTSPSTTPSGEQAAASSSPAPAPASGATQALDIKFTAVDGRVVDLASLRGKVVLIDFWATWCKPCMGEIPNVVAAYQKYHDQGFEVIGISFDTNKVTLQRVTEDMHMPWPQYFDGKGWQNDFGVKFGIHGIPTMWLIDQQGRLVTKNARTDLAGQVAKLLSTGTK
ncbi:TlpA family protein disulfide reductase [Prosthecobacter sp.]|uniref:TlpA family protein disulfide reductase n=1 Tax=Prosthecobacter sp. TaxID=1965333 RepID=UPI003783B1C5